jgi:hypothetical protein
MKKTRTEMAKSQIDKFKEAARELEADDSEEAFDAKLKKIAKAPPPQSGSKRKESGDKV